MSEPMTDTQTLHDWFDYSDADRPLLIIAGPCVLETPEINRQIGTEVSQICADLDIPYVFKASFDKANRTSVDSRRGPGLDEGDAQGHGLSQMAQAWPLDLPRLAKRLKLTPRL